MSGFASAFFEDIQVVFWLFYGLVFYTMGLSILLNSQHYSRLILAKSLPWLGGFGIIQGFFDWGYIVIPVFTETLGSQYSTLLMLMHQVILAFSFSALLQFGVELFRPFPPRLQWIRVIPFFVFMAWIIGPFIIGFSLISGVDEWSAFANACSRYFICAPAAVVSVSGLIHQQRLQIKPLKLPMIDNMIRLAAGALAAYGLLSGLIVPKTFFFPATIINHDSFVNVMLVSPFIFRSLAGILLLFSVVRALEIFNVETDELVRQMEEVQVISSEREHIARDLHDGALQQVYAAGLLAQSLKKHVSHDTSLEVDRLLEAINQAIVQLREFLPHHKSEITSVDLMGVLIPKIEEARRYIQIDTTWEKNQLPSLTIDQTRHLVALLSESLSNSIRHSQSEKIEVSLKYQNNLLVLELRDFGTGIAPFSEQGYGLKNMRDRARLLGADLSIESEISKGTVVKLVLPVEEKPDEH